MARRGGSQQRCRSSGPDHLSFVPVVIVLCVTLLICCLGVWPRTAQARIGETPEKCEQRYGPPVAYFEDWPEPVTECDPHEICEHEYQVKNWKLIIHFLNGQACRIDYEKRARDKQGRWLPVSDEEMKRLLEINFGKQTWYGCSVPLVDVFSGRRQSQDGFCSRNQRQRALRYLAGFPNAVTIEDVDTNAEHRAREEFHFWYDQIGAGQGDDTVKKTREQKKAKQSTRGL